MFSSAHDAKTNASRVVNGLEICRTKSDAKADLQTTRRFQPGLDSRCRRFYERDARSNASQPAGPSFREVSRFARGGSLAADPPENTSTTRPQGRDTRYEDRKIMALSHIRSRRVGAFEVKVSQLSVPSLTTEDRDETDEISARQPSDREACRWPEGLGVPMV